MGFVGIHAGKQIPDEQAELIKYTKLKALATILFEYVMILVLLLATNEFFRPNLEPLPDERKGLDVSDGDVSPI